MLAVALGLLLLGTPDEVDAGVFAVRGDDVGESLDASVPERYDSAPLRLDGRVIDFYPDAGPLLPEPPWLRFRGNKVLPEEMYRNALQLPSGSEPDPATALYIEETLYGFLVKSGYELATVGAVLTKDGIDVQIDEGQLEKVVFTGRLTFNTLRFRLELFIDQEVFNRPALERQIAVLSKKIGLPVVRWSLVPTPNPNHMGPQIETLGAIEGIQFLHARKRYELWFFFEEKEWDSGLGIDLRSGYIDGLEVGLNYQGMGLYGDRWRVAASGGMGLRWRIDDHTLYPGFSRAYAEGQWFSQKYFERLRWGVWLNGNLLSRQRWDLDVEDFREANASLSMHVTIDLSQSAKLVPTLGVQWRRVYDIKETPRWDERLVPEHNQRLWAFAELLAEWVVDPENQRWDRRHKLELGARWYFGRALDPVPAGAPTFVSYGWLTERYQKVFEFGWHDLWLKTRARVLFGDSQFQDEENVGEVLKGVFGGTFVRKAGNVGAEFRFSLNRDVLKLSFFTEVAAFGEVCRLENPVINPDFTGDRGACRINPNKNGEVFRLGFSAGPGIHALIQGMFQIDIYTTVGVRTRSAEFGDSPFSFGVVGFLNKTY